MLQQILQEIPPVDAGKSRQAQEAWDNIAKPLHSLGKLEDLVCQMAGIYRTLDFSIAKKGLLIFCADNGVVEEGVSQTGQEVTGVVAENFLVNSPALPSCVSEPASPYAPLTLE